MQTAVHFSSATDAWYTPPVVLAVARAALGGIDLDPASSIDAQQTVRAEHYYTTFDDGLARPWFGRVFCNPPYSRAAAWVARAIGAYAAGEIDAVLLLLAARPDTAWFQEHAAQGHLCWWRGRLRFSGHKDSAPFPSLLVYCGPAPERFHGAAAPYGLISPPLRPLAAVHKAA